MRRNRPFDVSALEATLSGLLGRQFPIGVRLWDGTTVGPSNPAATMVFKSPLALRQLLWAPGDLGLGRAYVSGELDFEGDLEAVMSLRQEIRAQVSRPRPEQLVLLTRLILQVVEAGGIWPPPPVPAQEARMHGRRHTRKRDAAAIAHHYDAPESFYRLFLGETMVYSCAYFEHPESTLDQAQRAKLDLVCLKLGLRPGMRLLDVGCGWGSMVIHASRHYGCRAVGVTISKGQAETARRRVRQMGVEHLVEIRVQDYRDVNDGPYDAISSIGMFEHVGLSQLSNYLHRVQRLLVAGGRLLNHAISRPAGVAAPLPRRSFVNRYVFPDGELHEVGSVVSSIQATGLEVRDVESLREHYVRTLGSWGQNLDSAWEEACRTVGEARARVWRLYMAGSAASFSSGRISVHQVLAVRPGPRGASGMPPTRAELLRGPLAEAV